MSENKDIIKLKQIYRDLEELWQNLPIEKAIKKLKRAIKNGRE